jgi:hypothetical protein
MSFGIRVLQPRVDEVRERFSERKEKRSRHRTTLEVVFRRRRRRLAPTLRVLKGVGRDGAGALRHVEEWSFVGRFFKTLPIWYDAVTRDLR